MKIKYRKPDGTVKEVDGDLFVTFDKHGKDVYAGDGVMFGGEECVITMDAAIQFPMTKDIINNFHSDNIELIEEHEDG